jgi:hypothetical protein
LASVEEGVSSSLSDRPVVVLAQMDRGTRARARAGIAVIAIAVTVGLLSLPASAATTPNLTGSWINVAAPTAPAWALQASANLSSLSASWNGSVANGHPGLVGGADGLILNLARTMYSGRYDVKEGGADFPGDMTITIVSRNRITISLTGDNGIKSTYTFGRSAGSPVPPALSWCTGATTAAPAAACLGGQTNPIPLPAGGGALEASPDLTAGQTAATISVSESGDTPANVDGVTATGQQGKPRASRCVAVAAALAHPLSHSEEVDYEFNIADDLGVNYWFARLLVACVAYLHQAQAATAGMASASCPVSPFKIKVQASGNSLLYKRLAGHVHPPLAVTCTRTATGFTVHLKARSPHTSLKSFFGSRLLLGVYHSLVASQFAMVTATFTNH